MVFVEVTGPYHAREWVSIIELVLELGKCGIQIRWVVYVDDVKIIDRPTDKLSQSLEKSSD